MIRVRDIIIIDTREQGMIYSILTCPHSALLGLLSESYLFRSVYYHTDQDLAVSLVN